MPAAAVIPAPIAYTNTVAVKKRVVEFLQWRQSASRACTVRRGNLAGFPLIPLTGCLGWLASLL